MEEIRGFTFFRSYDLTGAGLSQEDELEGYRAIIRFMFCDEEPDFASPYMRIWFGALRPNLENSKIKAKNGGGKRKKDQAEAEAGEGEPEPEEQQTQVAFADDFSRFWGEYPKKDGKTEAYRLFGQRVQEGYAGADLVEAARKYKAQCQKNHRDEQYILSAKNFLGDLRFQDYLVNDAAKAEFKENPFEDYVR